MKKRWKLRGSQGQSVVELTLTLPILLLMLAGLVEIGSALFDYLVLVNANREGTRMAARGRWFDSPDEVNYLFARVVSAAGDQKHGGDFVPFLRPKPDGSAPANATIAIHYIEVPDQIDDVGALQVESAIIYGPWYTGTLYSGETRVDAPAIAELARQENYEFNRKHFVENENLDIPSEDNFVIVEVWYQHEQLLKLPFFTEFLPERFTFYSRGQMRVTLDSRVH